MDSDRLRINKILVLLAEGDRTAFDEAYALMWPIILSTAKRLVGNTVDAEDIAQETLIKVFEQVGDFDSSKDGVAWALTIAKFEFMTLRKSRLRRKETSVNDGEFKSEELNAADYLEEKRIENLLNTIISELSGEDKETIQTYLRASNEARSPKLRKRFQRAIARIRAAWKESYG